MIGILIVAHAPLASALRECALHVFPDCASGVQALDIAPNASPEESLQLAKAAMAKLNTSEVLLLSDVFGATPSNVAQYLIDGIDTRLLAGVNLPMLLRTVCYRHEDVHALAKRAVDGRVSFFARAEHEGEVKNCEFLDLRSEDARVHRGHFQRAALDGRHVGLVAAQRAAGEQVDLDLAAGLGRDDLGELLHAQHDGVALGVLGGELDGFVLGLGGAESSNGGQGGAALDLLAGLLSRMYPDANTPDARREVAKAFSGLRYNFPALFDELSPSPEQEERAQKAKEQFPGSAGALAVGPGIRTLLARFAGRVGLALHYELCREIVPETGAVLVRVLTNASLIDGDFP